MLLFRLGDVPLEFGAASERLFGEVPGLGGGRLGFGTGSARRWTYPLGLCNVSGVVGGRIWSGSERIRWGCTTYREWLYNVSDGVRRWSDGVRNRVGAPLDVSVVVMQRIGSGCWTYRLGFRIASLGLYNVSGGPRRWSVSSGSLNASSISPKYPLSLSKRSTARRCLGS
jgi:hypothetical protein